MVGKFQAWLEGRRPHAYGRRPALVLLNGLAGQAESWFRNHDFWRRHFDVAMPNLLDYESDALHSHLEAGLPVSVDYLVSQLHQYLESFVQTPPYHLVASSMGGKVAVEYAACYPERVARLVLLCPSGLADEEHLPVVQGLRRSDVRGLIDAVFFNPRCVDPGLVAYYRERFARRRWRIGLLRTVRGTMGHRIGGRLAVVRAPTLLVCGREDRIVNPQHAALAARLLPQGRFLAVPQCGHAPQIEKAWLINRLVVHFLTQPQPAPAGRRRAGEPAAPAAYDRAVFVT